MAHRTPKRRMDRRDVLRLLAAGSVGTALPGCHGKQPSETSVAVEQPATSDVPLQVTLVGNQDDGQLMDRAWQSVASQSLDVQAVALDRADARGAIGQLPSLAKKSDLLIYPLCGVSDLYDAEVIQPIREEDFTAADDELGQMFVALRNGVASYAGELVGLPLGAKLPALVTAEAADSLSTWDEYASWIGDVNGLAAEPLVAGWAGQMFLWRVATVLESGWLFERDGMKPLIDGEVYVEVLNQMKKASDRYQGDRATPAQIWAGIQSGKLRGGICFQVGMGEEQVSVVDLPGPQSSRRVLFDPFLPMISLSSFSRQSRLSKRFSTWLSGGDGSDSLRRQISWITSVREPRAESGGAQQQASPYAQWLNGRLEMLITLPALQLRSGADYYHQLDRQVLRCLDGEATAEEALASVAAAWRELNESVGIAKQERAWRRAQGMRG